MRNSKTLTLIVAVVALVLTTAASAERTYVDPTGDAGAAPDITGVRVTHDAEGIVTLAVTTSRAALGPDESFWGYFDTDRNPATGLPFRGLGADHFFLADAEGGMLFHVDGNFISIDFDSGFAATYVGGTFTARIARDDLGNPERFAFVVEAELEDANGETVASDIAPDAAPLFEYAFAPVVVTLAPVTGAPRVPVPGKRFVATTKVTRSDGQAVAAATVTCVARAGKLKVASVGSLASGAARCAMRVPKATTGRLLRGTVTVGIDGSAPVGRSFSLRIR